MGYVQAELLLQRLFSLLNCFFKKGTFEGFSTYDEVCQALKIDLETSRALVKLGVTRGHFQLHDDRSFRVLNLYEKHIPSPTLYSTAYNSLTLCNYSSPDNSVVVSPKEIRKHTSHTSNRDPESQILQPRARSKSSAKADVVKEILKGNCKAMDPALASVWSMARTYEAQLGVYKGRKLTYFKSGELTSRQTKALGRAVDHANALGIDFVTYVKAQFWYFDKHFSREPRIQEMGSTTSKVNSLDRAKLYLSVVRNGLVDPQREVISRIAKAPKPRKDFKFEQCENTLKTMMKNFKITEEQVFRAFKGPQIALYFDQQWLDQNETYKRLKAAGEI